MCVLSGPHHHRSAHCDRLATTDSAGAGWPGHTAPTCHQPVIISRQFGLASLQQSRHGGTQPLHITCRVRGGGAHGAAPPGTTRQCTVSMFCGSVMSGRGPGYAWRCAVNTTMQSQSCTLHQKTVKTVLSIKRVVSIFRFRYLCVRLQERAGTTARAGHHHQYLPGEARNQGGRDKEICPAFISIAASAATHRALL